MSTARPPWGASRAVPDGTTVSWGARAIDYGGTIDIPPDRQGCSDSPVEDRRALLEALQESLPMQALEAVVTGLPHGDEVRVVYTDARVTVAARRTGGYIYLAAWSTVSEEASA